MATTTTTATATTTDAASKKPQRVQPPNKDEFQKNLTQLEKDLRAKEKDVETAREAVNKLQNGGGANNANPEVKKLRDELDQLKKKQAELKASRQKIMDEVKMLDERCKKKVKDLQQQKAKSNFKSVEDIDKQIKFLEKQVDSGNLRLVDEKKNLADISSLKRLKKNFGGFADAQASIDADRARIGELKNQLNGDNDAKQTSDRFNEVKTQLDAMRDEQHTAYKNKNALYDKRNAAVTARNEVRDQIKDIKDKYYAQVRAYNEQRKKENQARIEKEKAEKAAFEKERKLRDAREKVEEAAEPAFAGQIAVAENLLVYFDPEYKRAGAGNTVDDQFAAKSSRSVGTMPQGAKIIKKETPDFFSGGSAQNKKKKGGKSDKFSLNVSIIEDLANLNIGVPSGKEDVPTTIEKLKEKIGYFKENQDRVTAEQVEKAKADLAKAEKEFEGGQAKETEAAA